MGFEDMDAGNYQDWESQSEMMDAGIPAGPQSQAERPESDYILEDLWDAVRDLGPISNLELQDTVITYANGEERVFDFELSAEQANEITGLLADFYLAVGRDSEAFYDGLYRMDLYFNGGSDSRREGVDEYPAFSGFFLHDLLPKYTSDVGLANWLFELSEDLSPRAGGVENQLDLLSARVNRMLTEDHFRYLEGIDIRAELVKNQNIDTQDKVALIQRIYDSIPENIRPLEVPFYAQVILALNDCPDTPQNILDEIASNQAFQEILGEGM